MVSRADALTWRAEGASHRGSSHERSGAPNQDAYAVRRVDHALVAAVADGHGGRRYVRSGTGAQIAVDLATTIGAELLDVRHPDPTLAGRALPVRLVPAWRSAVLAHLAAHALEDDEVERCGDLPSDLTVLYGATLIVALASGRAIAVTQIGDGAALTVHHGGAGSLVPGDDRLVANETTSLCLPTALDDFRHGSTTVEGDEPPLVLLSTDGYGNSFASEEWESEVMADLTTQVGLHGFDTVCGSIPQWVAESAEVGGDDVTVVLLTAGAAPGGGAAHGPSGPGARRRWWVPGIALTGLALTAVLLVTQPWTGGTASPMSPSTPVVDTGQAPRTTPARTTTPTTTPTVRSRPRPQGQTVPVQTTPTVSTTTSNGPVVAEDGAPSGTS